MATGYYSSERAELHRFLPKDIRRLLDVGCAEGGFGAAVKARNSEIELWGVEPNTAAASVAKSKFAHVVNGRFDADTTLPDSYFDVVTFNDSLEHMPDEYAALRLAKTKLRPGGVLICTVPNVRFMENLRQLLVEADWKYGDSGVLDRTHLRFFTRKSIVRTIEECGFSVKSVEGINSHWWTGWKIMLLRLVFRHHIEDTRWQQFVVSAVAR